MELWIFSTIRKGGFHNRFFDIWRNDAFGEKSEGVNLCYVYKKKSVQEQIFVFVLDANVFCMAYTQDVKIKKDWLSIITGYRIYSYRITGFILNILYKNWCIFAAVVYQYISF